MAINLSSNALPKHWAITKLPDFTHVVMGQSPSSDTYNFNGTGLPFFQGKAEFGVTYPTINKYCSIPNKIAEKGATLLSVRAPVGPTNLASTRCCIGRGLAAIHPLSGVDPKFILLLFRSIELNLSGEGTGSTFSAITKAYVDDLKFAIPPLNEQKRIVAKIEELFSELDKGIESLQTAREQLKVYRQAVLKHAFEGKLTEQWRKDNADKLESPEQLLARIQQERDTRYQQQLEDWKTAVKEWENNGKEGKSPPRPKQFKCTTSKLSESERLPKGWGIIPIEELIAFGPTNGWSPKATNEVTSTKSITLTATTSGRFDESYFKYIDAKIPNSSSLWLKTNDILVQRGNTIEYVGVPALYRGRDNQFIYPDLMMKIQTTASVSPQYLVFAMSMVSSRNFLRERAVGAAGSMPKINQQTICNLPIPICSQSEQKKVTELLEERFSVIESNLSDIDVQLKKAETLRQSILKKAFSGQLVPQDPNDEPASELLARIQAEKAALSPRVKTTRKSK